MEVGETGVGGGWLASFLMFLWGGIRNACVLLAELCSLRSKLSSHAAPSAEFALKFNSFRQITGKLTDSCPPVCFEILVIVTMNGWKL